MQTGTLAIKSPCFDPVKVEITAPDSVPDYLYWLSSENTSQQAFFSFEDAVTTDLTTTTEGFVSTCLLTRTIVYDGTVPVTTVSTPLKLLTTTGTTFELFENNYSLVTSDPINTYTIKYCFT